MVDGEGDREGGSASLRPTAREPRHPVGRPWRPVLSLRRQEESRWRRPRLRCAPQRQPSPGRCPSASSHLSRSPAHSCLLSPSFRHHLPQSLQTLSLLGLRRCEPGPSTFLGLHLSSASPTARCPRPGVIQGVHRQALENPFLQNTGCDHRRHGLVMWWAATEEGQRPANEPNLPQGRGAGEDLCCPHLPLGVCPATPHPATKAPTPRGLAANFKEESPPLPVPAQTPSRPFCWAPTSPPRVQARAQLLPPQQPLASRTSHFPSWKELEKSFVPKETHAHGGEISENDIK